MQGPDLTGKNRKPLEDGSSISIGKFLDFFWWVLVNFQCFPEGDGHKSPKKNPKIFRLEYCFHLPMVSGVFLPNTIFFPASFFRVPAKSDYFRLQESQTQGCSNTFRQVNEHRQEHSNRKTHLISFKFVFNAVNINSSSHMFRQMYYSDSVRAQKNCSQIFFQNTSQFFTTPSPY